MLNQENADDSDIAFHLGSNTPATFSRQLVIDDFINTPKQSIILVRWDCNVVVWRPNEETSPASLSIDDAIKDEKRLLGARVKNFLHYYSSNFNPTGTWLIYLEDNSYQDWAARFQESHFPHVIQHHRRKGNSNCIFPLPNYQIFPSRNIPDISSARSFKDRKPKVFWRGTLTGSRRSDDGSVVTTRSIWRSNLTADEKFSALSSFPRVKLCFDAKGYASFDIGLHLGENSGDILSNVPHVSEFIKEFQAPIEQSRYRYLLCLDGFDWPSNFYWALLSGSVVFREISEWQTYGDNHFQPWVHYVPVEPSVNDIASKLHWCESNIDASAEIAKNATLSARAFFDLSVQKRRIEHIIKNYENIFID